MSLLLDLFCGEGGASAGYARAGFEVVGVDNTLARLKNYPYDSYQGDAVKFLLKHGWEFDVIHASPPCTGYSQGTVAVSDRLGKYDRLIGATRQALEIVGKPYIIENVYGARAELRNPTLLCWSMFFDLGSVVDDDGTPLRMERHRLFETNWSLFPPAMCNHPRRMQVAGAYGGARRDKWEAKHVRGGGYVPESVDILRELLGTPWMSEKGCQLSIPPAYTHWIGTQLLEEIT